ncbi:IclR family transcriptional regulator [Glutamicibacter uratoxydans]|uniref:IclR family transcriptional regulator n=1 Tax=Glutamicibacter uratoxydans TaxID=43667 RepID=UPI003D6E30A9
MREHASTKGRPKDTAIDKALMILETLNGRDRDKSLSSICSETGLPKTTVHRVLTILEARGFVDRTQSNGFIVGRKVISLGVAAAERDSLVNAARPILRELVSLTNETVQLGVLQEMQVLYVDRMEPVDSSVRLARMPSLLAELHTSAMGKALLAFAEPAALNAFLDRPLTQYTDSTVIDRQQLIVELEQIRIGRVAVASQERYHGVTAVGSPILDNQGYAHAAISVAGPAHRMTKEKQEQIAQILPAAAEELSVLASHLR